IGHDALAFDDKSRATHPANRIEAPGRVPSGLLSEGGDLDDGALRFGGGAGRYPGKGQAKDRFLSEHLLKVGEWTGLVKRFCPEVAKRLGNRSSKSAQPRAITPFFPHRRTSLRRARNRL